MTNENPRWGEFCRLLAKILIQIQRAQFKESPEYEFMFHSCSFDLREFVVECVEKNYSWEYIRRTCGCHVDCNQYFYCITFKELTELFPYESVDNVDEVESICLKVISEQPQAVTDYKKGKLNSINRLKGQVMKMTQGKANAKVVDETLQRLLK